MGLRWMFNCANWNPTLAQFSSALSAVQEEERKRVASFVFKKDAKTALIGRLMIRRAVALMTGLQNHQIKLGRSQSGRPYLIAPTNTSPKPQANSLNTDISTNHTNYPSNTDTVKDYNTIFDFNISHDAEVVVLACEASRVGVDVMQLSRPVGSGSVARFFELMHRHFHTNEWAYVKKDSCERMQLRRFYRLWCMKESYVKALGDGVGFSLERLQCCIRQEHPTGGGSIQNDQVTSSCVKVDGEVDVDCSFEESILLGSHMVCVALKQGVAGKGRFEEMSIAELLCGIERVGDDDDQFQKDFEAFQCKPASPSHPVPESSSNVL